MRAIRAPTFRQTVFQSDNSTFTIRTTSPKSTLVMVKDVLNHPTWNNIVFKETGGDVDKFMEKYGQLDFEKL